MIRMIDKKLSEMSIREAEIRGRNILKDILKYDDNSDTTDFQTTKIKDCLDAKSITNGFKYGYEIKMRDKDRFNGCDTLMMEADKFHNLSFYKYLHALQEIYYVVIFGVNADDVFFFRLSDIQNQLDALTIKTVNCNFQTLTDSETKKDKDCIFLPKSLASSRFSFTVSPFDGTGKYRWFRY